MPEKRLVHHSFIHHIDVFSMLRNTYAFDEGNSRLSHILQYPFPVLSISAPDKPI